MNVKRIVLIISLVLSTCGFFAYRHYAEAGCIPTPTTGDDVIACSGSSSTVYGDTTTGDGLGNDTITNSGTISIISGDTDTGNGSGNDTITNSGTVSIIFGDTNIGDGSGNDAITNSGSVSIIFGDTNIGDGWGSDAIINSGTTSLIFGDANIGNGWGSDTIINSGTTTIVAGDTNVGDGWGSDTVINSGTATIVVGDTIVGDGSGHDTIINSGTAGDMIGDTSSGNGSGNDTIINSGTVDNIYGDSPSGVGSGDDTIINSGTVTTGLYANGGNDVVIIQNGAKVFAVMDGGSDTDQLVFDLTAPTYEELQRYADIIFATSIGSGTITIDGNVYNWVNFEELLAWLSLRSTCTFNSIQVFHPDASTFQVYGAANSTDGFLIADFDTSQLAHNINGQRFQASSTDWYIVVYWIEDGAAGHYQINAYTPWDALISDRCTFQ